MDLHIPGYSDLKILFQNRRSVVLRALTDSPNDTPGLKYILKLLNTQHPSPLQWLAFQRQFEVCSRLRHLNGVVKVVSLERCGNSPVSVLRGGRVWLLTQYALSITDAGVRRLWRAIGCKLVHEKSAAGTASRCRNQGETRPFALFASLSSVRPRLSRLRKRSLRFTHKASFTRISTRTMSCSTNRMACCK